MARSENIPLEEEMVSILDQCGPALTYVLHSKFGCTAVLHGVDAGAGALKFKKPGEERFSTQLSKGLKVSVWKDDLTTHKADAVVNAANVNLHHAGGVARAICDAGGPDIQRESDQYTKLYGRLSTGDAIVAEPGRLPCKKIIHAVGPCLPYKPMKYHIDDAVPELTKTVISILQMLKQEKLQSVAIPAISSGLFNFPLPLCADVIVQTLKEYHDRDYSGAPLEIRLVNHDDPSVGEMERACRQILGYSGTQSQPAAHQGQPPKAPYTQPAAPQGQPPKASNSQPAAPEGQPPKAPYTQPAVAQWQPPKAPYIQPVMAQWQPPKAPYSQPVSHGTGSTPTSLKINNFTLNIKNGYIERQKAFEDKLKGLQDVMRYPSSSNSASTQVFKQETVHSDSRDARKSVQPFIELCSAYPETLREARRWYLDVLYPDSKNVITIHNNFIQHFGQREFEELLSLQTKREVSIEENFKDGRFGLTIQGASRGFKAAVLEVEALCCKVQENYAKEGLSLMGLQSPISSPRKPVDDNSSDYKERRQHFLGLQIVRVEKVENKALKQVFDLRKRQLQVFTSPQRMYQRLPVQFCDLLSRVGFQMEFAPPDEQNLGEGIYFSGSVHGAERLWKGSADEEYLYFIEAQVLTGKSIVGCPGLIVPPPFARDPLTLYHSVKGGGDTWVIFNGHQALPEYLITCKKPTYVKPHALFNWGKAKKPQENEDIVIEGREVDQVNHWIKDLNLKEPESSSIPHDAVYLPESHHQSIGDMRIQETLRKARDKESFNRNIKVTSNKVDWQYQQQPGGQYQRFHPIHNFHLQQALERKQPRVEASVRDKMYKFTLPDRAANNTSRNGLKSRQIDKLAAQPIESLPQYWDAMPATTSCLSCLIQPRSPEHNAVLNLFRATCHKKVIKIERIQNPTLWRSLQIKKHDMELRNGHQKNEKRLFHGTCHTNINHINNHGFNRSFAGKNATAFGNGTYFAVGASYSASNTYSRPDRQGQKYMYLCRVLTGDFTAGRHGMTVPPAKSTTTVELYNSVTDNPSGPSMFVVFHDNQAYPEYLITFF